MEEFDGDINWKTIHLTREGHRQVRYNSQLHHTTLDIQAILDTHVQSGRAISITAVTVGSGLCVVIVHTAGTIFVFFDPYVDETIIIPTTLKVTSSTNIGNKVVFNVGGVLTSITPTGIIEDVTLYNEGEELTIKGVTNLRRIYSGVIVFGNKKYMVYDDLTFEIYDGDMGIFGKNAGDVDISIGSSSYRGIPLNIFYSPTDVFSKDEDDILIAYRGTIKYHIDKYNLSTHELGDTIDFDRILIFKAMSKTVLFLVDTDDNIVIYDVFLKVSRQYRPADLDLPDDFFKQHIKTSTGIGTTYRGMVYNLSYSRLDVFFL